jgi:hypothetical protein
LGFASTEKRTGYALDGIRMDRLDRALEVIPEDLRSDVPIDIERLAHDWEIELHIWWRPHHGDVLVFDPRV